MRLDSALRKRLRVALRVATDAATEAGSVIKRKFGRHRQLGEKPDTSYVTDVDRASEKLILKLLRKRFPHDHIVAEETGLSEGQQVSPFRWHVDPLDGTTNFVHGIPHFCVSIGLEFEQGDPILGVLYQPMTGDLYSCSRGDGSYRNGKRLRVSRTARLSNALLSTGFSLRRERFFEQEIGSFTRLASRCHAVRRTGSAALDLAFVATGQFDGFWERGLATWDTAAALALVAEAGGVFARMDGRKFRLGDDTLVAANPRIQAELLQTLNP